jgi:hypothetical protein
MTDLWGFQSGQQQAQQQQQATQLFQMQMAEGAQKIEEQGLVIKQTKQTMDQQAKVLQAIEQKKAQRQAQSGQQPDMSPADKQAQQLYDYADAYAESGQPVAAAEMADKASTLQKNQGEIAKQTADAQFHRATTAANLLQDVHDERSFRQAIGIYQMATGDTSAPWEKMQYSPELITKLKDLVTSAKDKAELAQKQSQAKLEEANAKSAAFEPALKAAETKEHEARAENLKKVGDAATLAARGDLLAAFADAGVTLPTGLRNKDTQNAALDGLMRKHPDMTPDEIAQGVKDGSISMAVSKTEGSVLARREAAILPVEKSITKPGGFLDQAEQAVNEVDFDNLKRAGQFEKWGKDELSDPALTSYKGAVTELRAEYAIVLSKGGLTTDKARDEADKVVPDIITKDQMKRIRRLVTNGIEASKRGVEESIRDLTDKDKSASGGGGKTLTYDPATGTFK